MSYPLGSQDAELVPQQNSENQFDIKKILYKIVGLLPWLTMGLIIALIAANLYLRYTPQQHWVAAYVLIKKEDEANLDYKVLKDLGVVQAFSDVLNQIDILKSYTLLERVVDSLKLNVHVRQQARVTKQQIFGEALPFYMSIIEKPKSQPCSYKLDLTRDGFTIYGAEGKRSYAYGDSVETQYGIMVLERNPEIKISPGGYLLNFESKHSEAASLRGTLSVGLTNDKGGGILELSMMDQIPERAIEILNKLIEVFNKADFEDKNIVTTRTIKFLSDRVDSVSKELNEIEVQEAQYKSNHKITNIELQGGAFQNQALLVDNDKIKQLGQYKILEALEDFINNFKNTNDIIPSSMGIAEGSLGKLILDHNDLVFNKQKLEKISTSSDPHLIEMNQAILDMRENLLRNIRLLKKSYQSTVLDLENNYNTLENKIGDIPDVQKKLLELARLIGVKQQLYTYLLQKKEEAQLSLASNINNIRIIDYANDLGVVTPKASQIKLLAILIGLLIPTGIMFLKDFLNNKISDKKEVEGATSVPIVGEIAYQKWRKGIIVNTRSRSPISEQFRLLRTNLHYAVPGRKLKTIMLSSFISGEGKSFVSINLANSLSVTGAKTIILEFDLRNPRMNKSLHISNEKGLSNYIAGDEPVENIIQTLDELNGISIITSGPVPPNPAELLLNQKTALLFDYLRLHFDYIIIDTAPVGLVTDALLLEKYADLTLFVVRHRFTLKAVLPYIERLNKDKKFKHMGIVVNGIKKDGSYGYSFGFGYSYSYYLHEKRNSLLQKAFSIFNKQQA
jgi:capsular exopolysaccharide synthesis family protein